MSPEQAHHESKAKLLDAALQVIRTKGYSATTIDDICLAAGLTKGSFFHPFKSKEVAASLSGNAVIVKKINLPVMTESELAAQLSALLDDSLDDLLAERDARRAVIATYARMERTLSGAGLPRAAAEAPLEYLGRVLRDLLHTSAGAVSKLTALFERAKFSHHEIDTTMKDEAIDALVSVRDELRAVAL